MKSKRNESSKILAKGKPKGLNRYAAILVKLFQSGYSAGLRSVPFKRDDIRRVAGKLKIELPKNLGDVIYSYRFRSDMPEQLKRVAPSGYVWVIRSSKPSQYKFELIREVVIAPAEHLSVTKIPDATPGIIAKYARGDEQALLARLRYNRLLDIFTGLACYSLQSHLRTTTEAGQAETDEIYVGIDKKGIHYVLPVQAKGGRDRLSVVQIEQDFAICSKKFPGLVCRAIAAQFVREGTIALFELENSSGSITISSERHYLLVPPDEISSDELVQYRNRLNE